MISRRLRAERVPPDLAPFLPKLDSGGGGQLPTRRDTNRPGAAVPPGAARPQLSRLVGPIL